ncbi:hypothetical protein [Mucilaginibacter flavus]|nr:hypothetical protein [Mucilaginibacter flavus]
MFLLKITRGLVKNAMGNDLVFLCLDTVQLLSFAIPLVNEQYVFVPNCP